MTQPKQKQVEKIYWLMILTPVVVFLTTASSSDWGVLIYFFVSILIAIIGTMLLIYPKYQEVKRAGVQASWVSVVYPLLWMVLLFFGAILIQFLFDSNL